MPPEEMHEHIPEPSTETGSPEGENETVEQLEDRLIIALESNEHLRGRVEQLERELAEFKSSRAVPEPGHSTDTGNPPDHTPLKRSPDTPPRAHTRIANWYFGKFGE